MNTIKYYQLIVILAFVVSCNEKPDYKEHSLYKSVCEHYENDTTFKMDAVDYIFHSIEDKFSYYNPSIYQAIGCLSDSLYKRIKKNDILTLIDKSMPKRISSPIHIYDLDTISSKALIGHIDTTYKQWEKMAPKSGATFTGYCDYILPYRISDEPVHKMPSSFFSSELSHFQDSLLVTDSITATIRAFIKEIHMDIHYPLGKSIRHKFSAIQAYKIRKNPRCDIIAVTLALSLRSIGIPATTDYVSQWGNHHSVGHRWLTVKWNGKWYAFEPLSGKVLHDLYRKESIVKVCRSTYALNPSTSKYCVDVTDEYVKSAKLSLKASVPEKYRPALAIFNQSLVVPSVTQCLA